MSSDGLSRRLDDKAMRQIRRSMSEGAVSTLLVRMHNDEKDLRRREKDERKKVDDLRRQESFSDSETTSSTGSFF